MAGFMKIRHSGAASSNDEKGVHPHSGLSLSIGGSDCSGSFTDTDHGHGHGSLCKLTIWAAGWLFLIALTGGVSSRAEAAETALSQAPEPVAIDYRAEMIRLVAAVAQRGRQANPDFGVFPQNGSELGASAEYLSIVTGIGQEDIYYGYLRNGKATPTEDTRYLEANLDRFRDAGRLVLTLDYPFPNKNNPSFSKSTRKKIDSAYVQSSSRGYIPYGAVLN